MAERCQKMATMVRDALSADKESDFDALYNKVSHYEQITDNMEVEIAEYLQKVSEGRLSHYSKNHISQMLRQVDELESIGDSLFHLARTLQRKRMNEPTKFVYAQVENINTMLNLIDKALYEMHGVLTEPENGFRSIKDNVEIEMQINGLRNRCREENLDAINKGEYNYRLGAFYNDFIAECEKIGDYVINTVQAEMAVNKVQE